MKENREIQGKNTNHILALVFSILVIISIAVYFQNIGPDDLPSIFNVVMIGLFVYLFGLGIYSLVRLLRNQTGVIITPEFIIDMTNIWGISRIQRAAIQKMEIKKVMGAKWLCLYLDQKVRDPFTTNRMNRFFLFLTKVQIGTPLLISESTIHMPVETLQQLLNENESPGSGDKSLKVLPQ